MRNPYAGIALQERLMMMIDYEKILNQLEDNEKLHEKHVASIHNHTKDTFSPPSGKNFGILNREFEDYELIAGYYSFWILKAKGIYGSIIFKFRVIANLFFNAAFDDSQLNFDDADEMNREC